MSMPVNCLTQGQIIDTSMEWTIDLCVQIPTPLACVMYVQELHIFLIMRPNFTW